MEAQYKRKPTIILTVILPVVLVVVLVGVIAYAFGDRWVPKAEASPLNVERAVLVPTSTGLVYQGKLTDGDAPANGAYDFEFALYDSRGTMVASGIDQAGQGVTAGLFSIVLDFGTDVFNGDARYLDVSIRRSGLGGRYTTLVPRIAIAPTPYALYGLKTKGYKNVLVVSPDGGNFGSVQDALNSITDNSASNKYLIWVGPGIYTEVVTMKPYVDIEGAGENVTKITATGNPQNATVIGSDNAELRFITIENTGASYYYNAPYGIAINNNGASPSLLHVTANASGGLAWNYGIYNNSSSPSMNNVIAQASGYSTFNAGVYNTTSSSPSMNNVTAIGITGGYNNYSYGVYNINASAPVMNNVTATAAGGDDSYGIYNNASSPTMNNVIATASSPDYGTIGVYNESSSPVMNNVTATGNGGQCFHQFICTNIGVYNGGNSSPTITRLIATATGSFVQANVAVANGGTGIVEIQNSQLIADTNTAQAGGGTLRIAHSFLNGGPIIGGGARVCAGNYDESYVFYPSGCP